MPEYVELAHARDVPRNRMKAFEVDGKKILIVNVEGELYAIENQCPHMGYPLYFGELEGKILKCGFHYKKFDVTTGEALGPDTTHLKKLEIKIEDSLVLVKI